MAIKSKSTYEPRELIEAGMYVARCYQMLEIGTNEENFMGDTKRLCKVRIGWELPELQKVFKEENGLQPHVISKEYTLSMNEKANLRKDLESWRGKKWTDEEANDFDITKLIGAPCLLNITHKASKKDATVFYEEISSITPLMKGQVCPPAVNKPMILSYDDWNEELFNSLPDFIKNKIISSEEYQQMRNPEKDKFLDELNQPLVPAGADDDEEPPF